MKLLKNILLLVTLAVSVLSTSAQAASKREVTFRWGIITGMKEYEIQISRDQEMTNVVGQAKTTTTQYKAYLRPGRYYYRIRSYDVKDLVGAWSSVEGISVNTAPPRQIEPANKKDFNNVKKIEFTWARASEGSRYVLEISQGKIIIFTRELDGGLSYTWQDPSDGDYEWRVGLRNQVGIEFGPKRLLRVSGNDPELAKKENESSEYIESPLSLGSLWGAGFLTKQGANNNFRSGGFGWRPRINLADQWKIDPELAMVVLKDANTGIFASVDGGGYLSFLFSDFELSAGGGVSWWVSHNMFMRVGGVVSYVFGGGRHRVFGGMQFLSGADVASVQNYSIGYGISLGSRGNGGK